MVSYTVRNLVPRSCFAVIKKEQQSLDLEENPISKLEDLLKDSGIVDTHYHIGPEIIPRRYDVISLSHTANTWGATIVLKNHMYSTSALAALARAHMGSRFLGSIVLNRFVGGLNPDAIQSAVSANRSLVNGPIDGEPPLVVWMPTIHSVSHLKTFGHSYDPRWAGCCSHDKDHDHKHDHKHDSKEHHELVEPAVVAFDEKLNPTPELIATLEMMAKTGCILATGHLSALEIMEVVPLAISLGIKKIIITHPHYPANMISDEQLKTLIKHPEVHIEHCLAIHTIEEVPLEEFAKSIKATGPDQVVLATDFGQIHNDPFPEGTKRYAREMEKHLGRHFSSADLLKMFSENGLRALGIKKNWSPIRYQG